MKILAIETSCDETAVAVVKNGTKILNSVITSSLAFHEKTGGIIPENAAREQVKCIIPVLNSTVDGKISIRGDIDALAVTIGPGLIGSLLVGVETAKTLAMVLSKPVIPVNHVLAHIYANFLNQKISQIKFPAVALVVSGGHTELFFMKDIRTIRWLGGTLDDAAGEAFDKIARLLDLGYPGGPAIAEAAISYKPTTHNQQLTTKFPRPMFGSKTPEFSFSGLKTAVFREVHKLKSLQKLHKETIQQLAFETQEAITDVLVRKTLQTATKYQAKSILLGGGVAANKRLSEKFNLQLTTYNLQLFVPPPSLCTDNASYIGSYAYFHYHPLPWREIQAQPDLSVEV